MLGRQVAQTEAEQEETAGVMAEEGTAGARVEVGLEEAGKEELVEVVGMVEASSPGFVTRPPRWSPCGLRLSSSHKLKGSLGNKCRARPGTQARSIPSRLEVVLWVEAREVVETRAGGQG